MKTMTQLKQEITKYMPLLEAKVKEIEKWFGEIVEDYEKNIKPIDLPYMVLHLYIYSHFSTKGYTNRMYFLHTQGVWECKLINGNELDNTVTLHLCKTTYLQLKRITKEMLEDEFLTQLVKGNPQTNDSYFKKLATLNLKRQM